MPLLKSASKGAFSKNVGKEMDAGKDQKQALAIAFATKRAASKKNKKPLMAMGGVPGASHGPSAPVSGGEDEGNAKGGMVYAEGGRVSHPEDDSHLQMKQALSDGRYQTAAEHAKDVMDLADPESSKAAEARRVHEMYHSGSKLMAEGGMAGEIMRKYQARMLADGGMVEPDNKEPGNNFDPYDEEAFKKESYDDDQISPQPEDSNEHADSDETARGTLFEKLKAKRKKF